MKIPDTSPLISYTHEMRSRYGETDRMGYVYYGRYLEFFEAARTEMIRSFGLSYREMEDSGIMLPVVHAEIEYKTPILYDDLMQIEVLVFDEPSVRLHTYYKVYLKGNDKPNAIGQVSLCFMKRDSRKPCRAPQQFIESLSG